MFGDDDDCEYEKYLNEGSMFGKMDREEWQNKQDRAREISSGFSSELFERDEGVWERVKKLEDK